MAHLVSRDGKLSVIAHSGVGLGVVDTTEDFSHEIAVDFAALSSAVNGFNSSDLNFKVGSDLQIQSGNSKIKLPLFALPKPTVMQSFGGGVVVSQDGWIMAGNVMAFTESDKEVDFAQGQRLLAKDGQLFFLTASSSGMNGFSIPCTGEIDVIVPSSSLTAATQALRKFPGRSTSDIVSLSSGRAGTIGIKCGNFYGNLSTTDGKKPYTRDIFNQVAAGSEKWNIPQSELLTFLKQCKSFVTPMRTGVTMRGSEDGMLLSFDSVDDTGEPSIDSSGTCEMLIEGNFHPATVCIRHKYLMEMVQNAGEGMEFRVMDRRGAYVTAGSYFGGYGHMTRSEVAK